MLARILAVSVLLFSVLFMPFGVSVILALAGMVYFNVFWEAPILFLISDVLYGVGETRFFGMVFISFVVSVIILFIVEISKKKFKFHSQ